jgi:hypothetical protein
MDREGDNIRNPISGIRRLIPDMETFSAIGFNWNSIINVDDQKLGSLPLGVPVPKKKRINPK